VTGKHPSQKTSHHPSDHVHDVVIVGAGLAGLTAAKLIQSAKLSSVVLEADDRPGGRLKTDRFEGFLLDHGFQVYLTNYQTACQFIHLDSLKLRSFQPGAMIRCGNSWHTFKDPLRSAWSRMIPDAIKTILSPIASWEDLWILSRYRHSLSKLNAFEVLDRPSVPTLDRLTNLGFSQRIIERFFRPFLGGIFLDDRLDIDSSRMEFVFREMGLGTAALPEQGIQAIPDSMCKNLAPNTVRFNSTVSKVFDGGVELSNGDKVFGRRVVVATDPSGAKRLLGERLPIVDKLPFRSTTCLYFSMETCAAPTHEPILFLNGNRSRSESTAINHVAFPSLVQPNYAPKGRVLASVNINSACEQRGSELVEQVQKELVHWFGWTVSTWKHLRTYQVPCAFVSPSLPMFDTADRGFYRLGSNLYACGDYTQSSSIEGAIHSGMLAATVLLTSSHP
jgi:phytoene dehydrogenase-like protein